MQNTHRDLQSTNNLYNQGFSSVSNSSQNHRLPKLDLPHFDGEILQWQTFWDSYESTIHFNSNLTEIQKFSYLKAQLHGHAAQTIEGFALTNAIYTTAVNLLKERFGSPHKIIHAYMKALMEMPTPSNSLQSLRSYVDKLEAYVRGLQSLGQTEEMYGALLVPVVLGKLPPEIRKNIAREHDSDNISLIELRKSIVKEIKILEIGQTTDYGDNHMTATFFAGAKSRQQPHYDNKQTKMPKGAHACVFCDGTHHSNECTMVKDPKDRIAILKRKKLCFNCLGSHLAKECKSHNKCRKCNKKHHTSLCGGRFVAEQKSQSVMSGGQNGDKTVPVVMHTSSTVKQHAHVLLKTEIAPVHFEHNYAEASILFDEGAQRSFITESLARKLNVEATEKETVQLAAFGDVSNNVRQLESTTIGIQTDSGDKIPIHALIVPSISVPMQTNMTRNVRNLPYLRSLKLAHSLSSHEQFDISLLIGADFYWKIVEDKVIRGDGPTAVSSKIGYLSSGPVSDNRTLSISPVLLSIISSHHMEEKSIENFWKLGSLGINPAETDEDLKYLQTYQLTSLRFENGQYHAKLPWKQDHPDLPSNFYIAKSRTESTIKRLSRKPELLHRYGDIIKDLEKRGFIEKEYLTSLREFHRTTGNNDRAINTGDVVHIHEDMLPRSKWKLAIVEELVTGNDGHVRSAVVRTSKGHTTRPIVKLYPIEVNGKIDFVRINDSIDHVKSDENTGRILSKREASVRANERIHKWIHGQ